MPTWAFTSAEPYVRRQQPRPADKHPSALESITSATVRWSSQRWSELRVCGAQAGTGIFTQTGGTNITPELDLGGQGQVPYRAGSKIRLYARDV